MFVNHVSTVMAVTAESCSLTAATEATALSPCDYGCLSHQLLRVVLQVRLSSHSRTKSVFTLVEEAKVDNQSIRPLIHARILQGLIASRSGLCQKFSTLGEMLTKVDSKFCVLSRGLVRSNVPSGTSQKERVRPAEAIENEVRSSNRIDSCCGNTVAASRYGRRCPGEQTWFFGRRRVRGSDDWEPGATGGALSLGLTGGRRPFYRLQYSDTVEVNFPFAPEFNQNLTLQPDGFVALRDTTAVLALGKTLAELQEEINVAYRNILRNPEASVTLKEFDKPYFIVSGEVKRPGKYELRSDTTLTEAVAIAGGFTGQARHSEVVLFRTLAADEEKARTLDIKKLLKSKSISEDVRLHPGDMVFVPQNTMSKVMKYVPNTGVYVNPLQY
jgi:polysaccharide export outer membrane protein